jgi:hypothetical protein
MDDKQFDAFARIVRDVRREATIGVFVGHRNRAKLRHGKK